MTIIDYSNEYWLEKYRKNLKALRNSSLINEETKKQIDIYFKTGNPNSFKDFNKLVMSNKELRKYYFGP